MSNNIYNLHDFVGNTYQHELNSASIPTLPENCAAFIDNSSIVDFGLIDNFDEDLNQAWIESNLDEIDELTNTCIYDLSELTIIEAG